MQDLVNLFFEYIGYIKADILTAMMSLLIISFVILGISYVLRVFNVTLKSKEDIDEDFERED